MHMKRCPTCNRTFTDQNLSFCLEDGTPLAPAPDLPEEVTVVSPSSRQTQGNRSSTDANQKTIEYQPPPAYVPPGGGEKRRVWPWVLGIMAALFIGLAGLGIVAALVVPKLIRQEGNRNRPIVVVQEPTNNGSTASVNENNTSANSNSNNNAENTNSNSETDSSAAAPTDAEEVLATLTSLEHDWTAANINADKQALDRILADDYVGTTPDGKSIGKAEYIRTIERDTTTQKWNFEDLTISLRGNRASLTGVVRFQTQGRELAFRFTDKFVWRDGRWQATGSEISQI